ncbi:hypothetical protein [Bacillus sp. ISL-45]|uniref:hypothetical protein n=1 Tax=Bacillus sp. ISL-45 TaxID=2819128 RepID=UPI001BE81DA7|nr:hypothetical protein [Bacillus sp. ISL-45]MBT2661632.1 hypothetical protein [Bacillus sp. ISL-45]
MGRNVTLIYNYKNNYEMLLKESEQIYKTKLNKYSTFFANGINEEFKFFIDISPMQLQLIFSDFVDESSMNHILEQTKVFIENNFKENKVGIQSENYYYSQYFKNIPEVKTIIM